MCWYKKGFFAALALSGLLCACLTACGSSNQGASSSASNNATSSGSASAAAIASSSSSTANKSTEIELNQTVATDDYELTLTGVEWTDSIQVQTSEYSSWTCDASNLDGEIMLVVTGTLKNLGANEYSTMAIDTNVKVNDKYNLEGTVTGPDHSISPLSSKELFFCAPMSNEMKEAFKDGVMTIELKPCEKDGNAIRIGTDPMGVYSLKIAA